MDITITISQLDIFNQLANIIGAWISPSHHLNCPATGSELTSQRRSPGVAQVASTQVAQGIHLWMWYDMIVYDMYSMMIYLHFTCDMI